MKSNLEARQRGIIDGDTTVTVLNGEASKVSPTEYNDRLARILTNHAFNVLRVVAMGDNPSFIQ